MPRPGTLPLIGKKEKESAEKQIKLTQRDIRYDTRDFPVETIVDRFSENNFFIPPYQREFVWNDKDQSAFMESVIIGLPIPMMFLAEDEVGSFEIVDGAQRIQTLHRFLGNDLALVGLEKLNELIGFTFDDLTDTQQKKLLNRALRIVILDSETSPESRKDLFERINKFGRILKPSERRSGALGGRFMGFLEECSKNILFRALCTVTPKMEQRKEPLELVTRFFAYSEEYLKFRHDVDVFLDRFVKSHLNHFDKARFEKEFTSTMMFVTKHFPYGFRKSFTNNMTPRVRFEAIAVGVNLALRKRPDLIPPPVAEWIDSDAFRTETTTHASNSARRMKDRIEFVRDRLLGRVAP